MIKPINTTPQKRIQAEFFSSKMNNEPVRDALTELGRPKKTKIGEDIRFVELNWRLDRPYVDKLRSGSGEFEKSIYEVRHTVEDIEYRTLFFVYEAKMVLVSFFQKTSQKTPQSEIELAWERMKQWIKAEKESQASKKRKSVSKKTHKRRK